MLPGEPSAGGTCAPCAGMRARGTRELLGEADRAPAPRQPQRKRCVRGGSKRCVPLLTNLHATHPGCCKVEVGRAHAVLRLGGRHVQRAPQQAARLGALHRHHHAAPSRHHAAGRQLHRRRRGARRRRDLHMRARRHMRLPPPPWWHRSTLPAQEISSSGSAPLDVTPPHGALAAPFPLATTSARTHLRDLCVQQHRVWRQALGQLLRHGANALGRQAAQRWARAQQVGRWRWRNQAPPSRSAPAPVKRSPPARAHTHANAHQLLPVASMRMTNSKSRELVPSSRSKKMPPLHAHRRHHHHHQGQGQTRALQVPAAPATLK